MAKVTGMLCQILTANIDDAGTDGTVYLGIGGREFHLDSTEDDFEKGSAREYFLGKPPIPGPTTGGPIDQRQVLDPDKNDPRKALPLDTNDLGRTPVYIRFEPENSATDDHWNLHFAAVLVYDAAFFNGYLVPDNYKDLWLGHKSGKILYLTKEFKNADIVSKGRKLAAQLKK